MTRGHPEFTFTVRFDTEIFYSLLASHLASEKNAMLLGAQNRDNTSLFSDWSDDFDIVDHKRGKKIGSISMKSIDCETGQQTSDEVLLPAAEAELNGDTFNCMSIPNSLGTSEKEQVLANRDYEENQFALFMEYGQSSTDNIGLIQLTPETQVESKCLLTAQAVPRSNHIADDSSFNGALVSHQNMLQPVVSNEDTVAFTADFSSSNQYQISSNACATTKTSNSNSSAVYDNEAYDKLDNIDKTGRFRPYPIVYKRQSSGNDLASQNTKMDQKLAYRCKDCSHVSKSSRMLRKHIYHSHIQCTPFNCAMCEYAANQNCDLSYHYLSVHKLDIDTVASLIRSSTRESERFSSPANSNSDVPTVVAKSSVQSSSRSSELAASQTSKVGSTTASTITHSKSPIFDVVNTLRTRSLKGSCTSTLPK